jgi:hypothetical protein
MWIQTPTDSLVDSDTHRLVGGAFRHWIQTPTGSLAEHFAIASTLGPDRCSGMRPIELAGLHKMGVYRPDAACFAASRENR